MQPVLPNRTGRPLKKNGIGQYSGPVPLQTGFLKQDSFDKDGFPFIRDFGSYGNKDTQGSNTHYEDGAFMNQEKPTDLPRISVKINHRLTERSIVSVSNIKPSTELSKEEFVCFLRLLKTVNLGKQTTYEDLDLPQLLIEIFLRILIKKRFVIKDFKDLNWCPETVNKLMLTPIAKKKEESLKYVIRETFAILNEKYRSIHYFYWNNINPKSSLKIERERNYYIGFTRFYFGDLIDENKKKGVKDQINNYTLPNKKNGNLKSNNKSITPKFLKRLFQSQKFYSDFMKILDSPHNGFFKKCLRNVLYSDAENKINSWLGMYDEFKGFKNLAHALKKKVSGSKAKLPWFRVEIESAIGIVKFHIMNIQATRFKSLYD